MRVKVTQQTKIYGNKAYPDDIITIKDEDFHKFKRVVEKIDFEEPLKKKHLDTSLGIVVLLSGRKFRRVQDWLRDCTKPECSLYILDSSQDDKFTQRVHRWLGSKAMQQFRKITYMTTKPKWHLKKTDTVGDLYNIVIPEVTERYIITLEDDVVPPLNGIDLLLDKPENAVVYGLSYMSRHGGYAVSDGDVFHRIKEKQEGIQEVQAIGGGFTLWNHTAFINIKRDRPYKGWDDWLCAKIRSDGGRVYCNFNILCEHLY